MIVIQSEDEYGLDCSLITYCDEENDHNGYHYNVFREGDDDYDWFNGSYDDKSIFTILPEAYAIY